MQRILLTLSYDGSAFYGFVHQRDLPNVYDALVLAITTLDPKATDFAGASRTDRGVHATGQRFCFSSSLKLAPATWQRIINQQLGETIRITAARRVAKDFHPRQYVAQKKYEYFINAGRFNLFNRNYCWHTPVADAHLLEAAVKMFIGVHRFDYFNVDKRPDAIMEREIITARVIKRGQQYRLQFVAKGFLRGQVRMMVASCVAVSNGKMTLEQLRRYLEVKTPQKWPTRAPAAGLYLRKITYQKRRKQDGLA